MRRCVLAIAGLAEAGVFAVPGFGGGQVSTEDSVGGSSHIGRLISLRRWLLVAGMLVAALSVPSAAEAAPEPAQDSAVGSGSTAFFTSFDFSVTSGPFGESPTGHIAVEVAGFGQFESSSITCMSVSGNAATIGGTLRPNTAGYVAVLATAVDNDATNSGPDAFSASPVNSAPTVCPAPTPFSGPFAAGDIVVRDAGLRRGLGCGDNNNTHLESSECK
jgi:hypothetical protein